MTSSLSNAQAAAAAHGDRIVDAVLDAWADFLQSCGSIRHKMSKGSESFVFRDYALFHLRRVFDGVPGVQWHKHRQLITLSINNVVLLRFKKLDHRQRSFDNNTLQSNNFLRQLPLPGMPDPALHVQAGYVLD